MNVFSECLQRGFASDQRVPAIGDDHNVGRGAGNEQRPKQRHAVSRTCFGHRRDAAGADIKAEKEDAGQEQGKPVLQSRLR